MFSSSQILQSSETSLLTALAAMLRATASLAELASVLERARTDDPVHPGWPAGAPDSQGGEFRPKDGDDVEVAGDIWVRPRRRRRKSGGVRSRALSEAAKRAVRLLIATGLRIATIEAPGLDTLLNIGLALAELAYPYVKAYFDPPKTLADLQAAALDPQPGYDIHHVVEGATAADSSEAARVDFAGQPSAHTDAQALGVERLVWDKIR